MSETITEAVKSKYGSVATSGLSSHHDGVRAVAEAFGYSPEELAAIPSEANMGLSCGNPTAFASLRPGETVVDLGSGGGLDVFLAARQVGPEGKAIGIDMTAEMIDLARRNAAQSALSNVEFHLAPIEQIPLPDGSVDCVISNCVINLATDKAAVFREIARILKPGGRLAVSDIALKAELPEELGNDLMAYVGCVAGAVPIEDYRRMLAEAGFAHVQVQDTGSDLNAYAKVENQSLCCPPPVAVPSGAGLGIVEPASCCTPVSTATTEPASCCTPVGPAAVVDDALHSRLADLLRRYNVNDYAASVRVYALKPKV